jgi:UDP-N-acetylglucosamine 4-epimerase
MINTSLFTSKKILVTGGAGFIGSNLVDFLATIKRIEIVVLDNLETGTIKNIQDHVNHGKVNFIKGDIRNLEDCLEASQGCDIVFHQAALGSVPRSIEMPLEIHATNVTGFLNMLEAARKNSVSRFIYASSSSVYGDDTSLPKTEDKTGRPLSPYAVSKKTNELYAKVYSDLYNMNVIGLRYFNVFGPKQNPNGPYAAVIPIFINKLLDGKICTIYGDGNNRRDFTYVSNVVQANILAATFSGPHPENRVFNVAYGATETINELHNKISNKLGNNLKPDYKASRVGEIKDSFADISKTKRVLGYSPEISLAEGIDKTIDWFRQNKEDVYC